MKNKFVQVLTNRFFIAPVCLLVWISFFDSNDIFSQLASKRQLQKLKDEKSYYIDKIEEVRVNYSELSSNPKTMEKYARERYFMKKENEEIFLIVEEKRKKNNEHSWIPQTLRNFFSKPEPEENASDTIEID